MQHDTIAQLNFSSVNTVRVYSVIKDNKVYIVSAALRIGNGNKPTDNYSAGGMAATIDVQTGLVISSAINKNGDRFYFHPFTNSKILGFSVPFWDKIIDTVKEAHLIIPDLRYVAWDIAITNHCEVVFIEGNTSGGVNLQQHPLLLGKKEVYEALL